MPRWHLFETGDLPWFPAVLRDYETDLLELLLGTFGVYDAAAPLVRRLLERAGASAVTDLCSGGGGPWARLLPRLSAALGREVRVTLTDLYPNVPALERVAAASGGAISFERAPVDATRVGASGGARTLFTAFHHFPPAVARRVLADARDARAAIGVFEFNARTLPSLLALLGAPLFAWAATPFMRPLRLSRFLLTYALPLVPLNVLWNGTVSNLRVYSPEELRALCDGLEGDGYEWEVGRTARTLTGPPITYLLGMPRGLN